MMVDILNILTLLRKQPFSEISGKYLLGRVSCDWILTLIQHVEQFKLLTDVGDADRDYVRWPFHQPPKREKDPLLKADIDTHASEMIQFIAGDESFDKRCIHR